MTNRRSPSSRPHSGLTYSSAAAGLIAATQMPCRRHTSASSTSLNAAASRAEQRVGGDEPAERLPPLRLAPALARHALGYAARDVHGGADRVRQPGREQVGPVHRSRPGVGLASAVPAQVTGGPRGPRRAQVGRRLQGAEPLREGTLAVRSPGQVVVTGGPAEAFRRPADLQVRQEPVDGRRRRRDSTPRRSLRPNARPRARLRAGRLPRASLPGGAAPGGRTRGGAGSARRPRPTPPARRAVAGSGRRTRGWSPRPIRQMGRGHHPGPRARRPGPPAARTAGAAG